MKSLCVRALHRQCRCSTALSSSSRHILIPTRRHIHSPRWITEKIQARNITYRSHLVAQTVSRRRAFATATETPKVLVNDLDSQEVIVDFNNGTATRYPSFWLRDHCPCSVCTHPQTRQRQVDTFELDAETKAKDIESLPEGLKVTWTKSNHQSIYPWNWLQAHTPFTATPAPFNPRGVWQSVSPSGPFPTVDYKHTMTTDAGLHTMLSQIRTYGLSFIKDTPVTTEATEALANRIAFIRQTHYGGFWEVVSEANPIDTAYTNLHLPNHTDNTYFTDPCGLQMFHCLSHTSSSSSNNNKTTSPSNPNQQLGEIEPNLGGESTFVDGFAAASKLHNVNPNFYKALSSIRITSHASGDSETGPIFNNSLTCSGFPVFNHAEDNSSAISKMGPNNLTQIRWNNSDRHSSTTFPSHRVMRTWYAAARAWNELIHDPEFEITVKLTPGVVVVFDNWRVLHGRKSFQGVRRLCGAYIGMDDFLAKARLMDGRVLASSSTCPFLSSSPASSAVDSSQSFDAATAATAAAGS